VNPLTELELVRGILEKVDTPLTSEEILSYALQATKDTFGLLACSIILIDPSREYFKVSLAKGWSNEFVKSFHGRPFRGLVADLAGMKEPLLVRQGDPRYQAEGYVFEDTYAALLALPLAIRGRKIGLLFLSSGKAGEFTPERVAACRDLANLVALVLSQGNLEQEIITLSDIDPLTNLYSYKYWHEELHREVARSEKMKNALSILEVRLNHMKEFNSAEGHAKGDEALKGFSNAIRAGVDDIDVPCRSGSKWYVLLTGKDAAAAARAAEKIVTAAKALPAKGDPRLTLSVGVATYEKGEGELDFVNRVGEALLEARRKGGFALHVR